ncbi:unnamed protein product [Orchesella dallaii]|uniref:Uncharacterized protein n=1 Tax=Orchesella dallaii TaxID=48710 RepID=A0ABP1R4I5_9HEXA
MKSRRSRIHNDVRPNNQYPHQIRKTDGHKQPGFYWKEGVSESLSSMHDIEDRSDDYSSTSNSM